jgi:hypothetical protein
VRASRSTADQRRRQFEPDSACGVTDGGSLGFLVESNLDRLGALWPRHEADELFLPPRSGRRGPSPEVARTARTRASPSHGLLRLPRAAHEAVDEHGRPSQIREDPFAVLVGHDAAAVGVGDEQVVVLRQKRGRAGVSGLGRGTSGRSSSSLPCSSQSARSHGRSRSVTSRGLGRPDQACTSLIVAEHGQVAHDQRFQREVGLERMAEPGLDRCSGGPSAGVPDPTGRHLYQRQEVANGVGKGHRVAAGPPLAAQRAELGAHARPFFQQCPAAMSASVSTPGRFWPKGLPVYTGRAPGQAAPTGAASGNPGGRQVQRRAHQRAAHRTPLGDQLCQLIGVEAVQPRPQADIGRVGHLSLQAGQTLDRLGSRQFLAA